jgi:hypothetical protein
MVGDHDIKWTFGYTYFHQSGPAVAGTSHSGSRSSEDHRENLRKGLFIFDR